MKEKVRSKVRWLCCFNPGFGNVVINKQQEGSDLRNGRIEDRVKNAGHKGVVSQLSRNM